MHLFWSKYSSALDQFDISHLIYFEEELIPVRRKYNIGFISWSPLASGLLTGKYNNGVPDNSRLNEIDWLKKIVYTEERIAAVKKLKIIAKLISESKELNLAGTLGSTML